MNTETAKLVTFGEGGDTVHLARNHTISGYGNPDNPHAARQSDARIIPDGTPAIDLRPAIETDKGFSWVFRGPLVNVDLPDGASDECPNPSPLLAEAVAGNSYGTLLGLQAVSRAKGEDRGPLDCVSIPEYIAGWRKVGARIGTYEDGRIVWEGGAE